MGLRAVVFDYGMVLTGQPDPEAHARMIELTGLPADRFEPLYWADRHAYDEGQMTGLEMWQKLARDGGVTLSADVLDELNQCDGRMWSTVNPAMVAWARALKQQGLLIGILSNMGDNVQQTLCRRHAWIQEFDVLVWSYLLRLAKPDPAIYHYTLGKLGTEPQETLFIDDKLVNIEAAQAVGMKAIQFSTVGQLKADLLAAGFDRELPLPIVE